MRGGLLGRDQACAYRVGLDRLGISSRGGNMSMCVARPENASLQPPPSAFPTPCASGRSVQHGNAVRVTLSWPHAARAAHAARIALPRQVWMRLRCPKLPREISDFDGHWKFSSPAARRCVTPCGEEYCCLGRRAKKNDTFVGRCAKCTRGRDRASGAASPASWTPLGSAFLRGTGGRQLYPL